MISRAVTNRTLARIERKASERAREIAQFIVDEIATNPNTPEDRSPDRPPHEHLRYSYYVAQARDGSGDWLIKSRSRYWVFVEFGTREHGDAQPHLRPAIELARAVHQ